MKKILVLLVMLSMLLSVPSLSFANGLTWEKLNSNLDIKDSSGRANAIQLKDGRVMVFGSKNSYIYDYKTQKWSTAAPHVQKGDSYAPVLLQDGRVMLFTGFDGDNYTRIKRAEIYNPNTNKWSFTGDLNTERNALINAVLMQDGRVMIAGGWYGNGNDVEIYNPKTNTWTKAADMNNQASSEVTFLPLNDGRILASGGRNKNNYVLEIYNPTNNKWEVHGESKDISNLTKKLFYLSDGSIFVLESYHTGIYHFNENNFNELTSSGFYATDAIELPGGRVLITGSDSSLTTGKAYVYTIKSRELIEITLPTARPLIYSLPNGKILAIGDTMRASEYTLDWKWNKIYTMTPPGIFLDVPQGYWAENEIKYLVDLSVINGIGKGNFGPESHVTHTQGAVMLARALQLDLNNRPDPGFKDLSSDFWAYNEIAALVDEGIYPKGTEFNSESPLTREDMARLLVNAFNLEGETDQKFKDVQNNYWASTYINKLSANKITNGYADGTFKPKNGLTRTEFSVFIARALDQKFR